MASKAQTASKIVQNPRLWPSSFSKPVTSQNTCIRTYIFKDGTKVEKFLNFVKKTFPKRKVDIKPLLDGKVSISITESKSLSATNYAKNIYNSNCTLPGCKTSQIRYSHYTLTSVTTIRGIPICIRKQTKYCASSVYNKCTISSTYYYC
jgi:hypothetical protein